MLSALMRCMGRQQDQNKHIEQNNTTNSVQICIPNVQIWPKSVEWTNSSQIHIPTDQIWCKFIPTYIFIPNSWIFIPNSWLPRTNSMPKWNPYISPHWTTWQPTQPWKSRTTLDDPCSASSHEQHDPFFAAKTASHHWHLNGPSYPAQSLQVWMCYFNVATFWKGPFPQQVHISLSSIRCVCCRLMCCHNSDLVWRYMACLTSRQVSHSSIGSWCVNEWHCKEDFIV